MSVHVDFIGDCYPSIDHVAVHLLPLFFDDSCCAGHHEEHDEDHPQGRSNNHTDQYRSGGAAETGILNWVIGVLFAGNGNGDIGVDSCNCYDVVVIASCSWRSSGRDWFQGSDSWSHCCRRT